MADPRCNCGEPDCPICTAPKHQPWQPKPGVSPDPLKVEVEQLRRINAYLTAKVAYDRWQALRRYLLVMLCANLGGLIGGWFAVWCFVNYYN